MFAVEGLLHWFRFTGKCFPQDNKAPSADAPSPQPAFGFASKSDDRTRIIAAVVGSVVGGVVLLAAGKRCTW
jgi:hypothetical protein